MHPIRVFECALGLGVLTLLPLAAGGRPEGAVSAAFLAPPPSATPDPFRYAPPLDPTIAVKANLDAAATRQGLPASLVEAVAYWESGWDQSRISPTGAAGLMQVQPETEADVATRLLGRRANLQDPADNCELGAAILKGLIADFGGNVRLGLAAYYQGEGAVRSNGLYADTVQYVTGIQALAARFERGEGPPTSS